MFISQGNGQRHGGIALKVDNLDEICKYKEYLKRAQRDRDIAFSNAGPKHDKINDGEKGSSSLPLVDMNIEWSILGENGSLQARRHVEPQLAPESNLITCAEVDVRRHVLARFHPGDQPLSAASRGHSACTASSRCGE